MPAVILMILKDLIKILDELFNKHLALENDAVGIQVGRLENDISRVMITLDVTGEVVEEAIKEKAGLVIAHHPLIFDPLKNILSTGTVGKRILKLIENNIAVYVAHTNFDAMPGGLNDGIIKKLGLKNPEIIEETPLQWYKFVVFAPTGAETKIREAIFENGGGEWADYSCCSFNLKGTGTFLPLENSQPYSGKKGTLNFVDEVRIECVIDEKNLHNLVNSVISAHPYEEPAYDIYRIENRLSDSGTARSGELDPPLSLPDFIEKIKRSLDIKALRWLAGPGYDCNSKLIRKVIVVNGSANSFTDRFLPQDLDCDLVIVGELKYSKAVDIINGGIILVELGHAESEKLSIGLMYDMLNPKPERLKGLKFIKSKCGFVPWRYYFG